MTISMKKGDAPVTLTKTPAITFRCTWPADTDYDLYAIVVYSDGSHEYIATFGAGKSKIGSRYTHPKKESTDDGSVKHLGDVQRGLGTAEEVIEVKLNDRIRAVIPVAYSAQSNGTGSFFQYQVTTEITAGDQKVTVSADNADDDKRVYTLVPGMLLNTPSGPQVHALENYSDRNSEKRPTVEVTDSTVHVVMDEGPKNEYK